MNIIQKIKCHIGFHTWSEKIICSDSSTYPNKSYYDSEFWVQYNCAHCSAKYQKELVGWYTSYEG